MSLGLESACAPHLRPQGPVTSAAATALDGGSHALPGWNA